jgi:hypothetical protein
MAALLPALLSVIASDNQECGTLCAKLGCDFYIPECPCACNTGCQSHNDCCTDWDDACGSGHGGAVGPCGGPEQHHLSLTAQTSEMIVSFASAKKGLEGQAPSCWLAAAGGGGANSTFEGSSHTYTAGGWVGLLHTVRFTGLSTSTRFSYACRVGSAVGKTYSFLSAPPTGHLPVTVAVVGDLGEGCNDAECGNTTIARLAADVAGGSSASPFSMLIHVGDIAYTSGTQTVWDAFLNEMEPVAAAVPYQVCVGNHEHYFNFSGYLGRFAMAAATPGPHATRRLPARASSPPLDVNNLYFSFDFGGVHFVVYSTEHDLTEQIAFMHADLAVVDRCARGCHALRPATRCATGALTRPPRSSQERHAVGGRLRAQADLLQHRR